MGYRNVARNPKIVHKETFASRVQPEENRWNFEKNNSDTARQLFGVAHFLLFFMRRNPQGGVGG